MSTLKNKEIQIKVLQALADKNITAEELNIFLTADMSENIQALQQSGESLYLLLGIMKNFINEYSSTFDEIINDRLDYHIKIKTTKN